MADCGVPGDPGDMGVVLGERELFIQYFCDAGPKDPLNLRGLGVRPLQGGGDR